MAETKKFRFAVTINAPREVVAGMMLRADVYSQWTSPFMEGGYFEGSWEEGGRIHFLAPNGEGMVSEVAEHRPNEFLSIRHIGVVKHGGEDPGLGPLLRGLHLPDRSRGHRIGRGAGSTRGVRGLHAGHLDPVPAAAEAAV